ncbi:MAG: YraN family protein [Saprospiraceae bacterium]|jgi:putative endonuclease
MADRHELGKRGEEITADWMRARGYQILERNWRYHRAEVDIIARFGGTLVFVEVKTRRSERFGAPFVFVGHRKQRFLASAAAAYADCSGFSGEIRFDVSSILFSGKDFHIEYLEDAFFPGG